MRGIGINSEGRLEMEANRAGARAAAGATVDLGRVPPSGKAASKGPVQRLKGLARTRISGLRQGLGEEIAKSLRDSGTSSNPGQMSSAVLNAVDLYAERLRWATEKRTELNATGTNSGERRSATLRVHAAVQDARAVLAGVEGAIESYRRAWVESGKSKEGEQEYRRASAFKKFAEQNIPRELKHLDLIDDDQDSPSQSSSVAGPEETVQWPRAEFDVWREETLQAKFSLLFGQDWLKSWQRGTFGGSRTLAAIRDHVVRYDEIKTQEYAREFRSRDAFVLLDVIEDELKNFHESHLGDRKDHTKAAIAGLIPTAIGWVGGEQGKLINFGGKQLAFRRNEKLPEKKAFDLLLREEFGIELGEERIQDTQRYQQVRRSLSPKDVKLRERLDAPPNRLLTKLNEGLIKAGLPHPGAYNQLEFQLNVPIPTPAGFVLLGGRLQISMDRDDSGNLTVLHCDFGLSCGYHVPGFTIKGTFGGYIEAKAESAEKLSRLLTYGLYERMRQSAVVPEGLVNLIYGGARGATGFRDSEKWSAKTEEEIFGAQELSEAEKEQLGDQQIDEDEDDLKRKEEQIAYKKYYLTIYPIEADRVSLQYLIWEAETAQKQLESRKKLRDRPSEWLAVRRDEKDSEWEGLRIKWGEVKNNKQLAANEREAQFAFLDERVKRVHREMQALEAMKESYVETGAFIEAKLEIGGGAANLKTEASYGEGRKIDREALLASKKGLARPREYISSREDRIATIGKSSRNFTVAFQAEVAAATLDAELNFNRQGTAERQGEGSWSIDLGLTGTWKAAFAGWTGVIIRGVDTAVTTSAKIYQSNRVQSWLKGGAVGDKDATTKVARAGELAAEAPTWVNAKLKVEESDDTWAKQLGTLTTPGDSPGSEPHWGQEGHYVTSDSGPGISGAEVKDDWGTRGADTQGMEGKVGVKLDLQIGLHPSFKLDGGLFLLETSELVVGGHTGTEASLFKAAMERGRKLVAFKSGGGAGVLKVVPLMGEAFGGRASAVKKYYFEKINEDQ